jgi:rare lipoprotein A
MRLIIPFILLSLLFAACGSSSRFEDKYKYPTTTSPTKEKKSVKKEKTPDPIVVDEYKDSPVLESQTGVASYYSDKFDGKKTTSGEIFRKNNLTAAHLKYPYNTILRVRNLLNNKSVIVRINDRKPDFNGRIIDVSYGAAKILDMLKNGITEVRIEVLKWGNK